MQKQNLEFEQSSPFGKAITIVFLGFFILILGAIGSVLLGLFVLSFIGREVIPNHYVYLLISQTCFGFVGILFSAMFSGSYIKKTKMDLESRRYVFEESKGNNSFIPFSEISKFYIKEEVQKSSSSQSNSSVKYYSLNFFKKDGGPVYITQSRSKSEIQELKQYLESEIKLDSESLIESDFGEIQLPKEVNSEASANGNFSLQWKNKVSFIRNLVSFYAIFSFLLTFGYSIYLMELGSIFSVIFCLVGFLFFYLVTKHLFRLIRIRSYIFEYDGKKFNYSYETIFGREQVGKVEKSAFFGSLVPLDSQALNNPIKEIWILNKDQKKSLNNIYEKLESGFEIGSAIKLFLDLIALKKSLCIAEFPGYTVNEILMIEKFIDKKILVGDSF